MIGCLSCDLAEGRANTPGGSIFEDEQLRVHHCIGPANLGTLIVQPKRHVVHVAELTAPEASHHGVTLQRAAAVITTLLNPAQVYACLWSLTGRDPLHIHWLVQPVTETLVSEYGASGPALQAAMFARNQIPDAQAVAAFAERAREIWPS